MKLNYKNFEIEVFDDPNYTLNSADNLKHYEKVYFDEKQQENQFYPSSKYAIVIKEYKIEITSILLCEIGWTTKVNNNSFIIENDKIWISIANKIYCFKIPSLELIWHKELDSFANFSIYKLEEDILIHGELEIFRITKNGDITWSFGGRDIWVNTEGKKEVSIENNTIRLFDFDSNEYVIDFNGNQIEDNPRIISKEIKKKWWKIFGQRFQKTCFLTAMITSLCFYF